jgi:hypothetical protein
MTAVATEQEIPLPREIADRGRPQQVHPVRATSTSMLLFGFGLFLLLAAGMCVFIYLKVPFKKNDTVPKETMLYIAAGLGVLGLGITAGSWGAMKRAGKSSDAYLVYPDALVLLEQDTCTVVRWNDVAALISPQNLGDYKITTRDGRTVPIKHAVKNYGNLIQAVMTRAASQILPPLYSALEEGETVTCGPFAVSQEAISYKGKTLPWDNVAALEIQVGQAGRRLRIRASGSLLPWCYANLESFPNGVFFHEVLRVVCPPRLLVPAR